MKYWKYQEEIVKGIQIDINETYVAYESPSEFAIFRFDREYINKKSYGFKVISKDRILLIEGNGSFTSSIFISNMNQDWNPDEPVFEYDDVNTYPWQMGNGISLRDRYWRIATNSEKKLLDKAIEIDRPLTLDEIRDVKLDDLGI